MNNAPNSNDTGRTILVVLTNGETVEVTGVARIERSAEGFTVFIDGGRNTVLAVENERLVYWVATDALTERQ